MNTSSRTFRISGGALLLLGALIAAAFINDAVTRVIESDSFRAMLEKETAKGMHFGQAHYGPLNRVGLFGVKTPVGGGDNGYKTIVSLRGENVAGTFNPLGIFLRRWQVQYLHFDTGTVWIQKTEGTPNAAKPPGLPWYLFFWPNRVYLSDIICDRADVLFKLQDKDSGIHQTFLEITPNGHDFEYDAKGGTFSTPMTPVLNVEHIHLLIRKPRLYCQTMTFGDDTAHPEQQLRVQGEAGLQQDRGIKVKADLDGLKVSPWLPEKMRSHVQGRMSGHFDYSSTGTGLETSKVEGDLSVLDGLLHDWKPIKLYTDATKSPDASELPLKTCRFHVRLDQGELTAENIVIESEGVFRVEGTLHIAKDKTISGELQMGLTEAYLKWLPSATTDIFTRAQDGYHFGTVHLSGTTKKPAQDLTPRLTAELTRHPFVAVKLFFNAPDDWLNFD